MNKPHTLIFDDYAARDLPADIVGGIDVMHPVKVKLEDGVTRPRFMKFRGMAAYKNTSIEEAVARIRSLRDDLD